MIRALRNSQSSMLNSIKNSGLHVMQCYILTILVAPCTCALLIKLPVCFQMSGKYRWVSVV